MSAAAPRAERSAVADRDPPTSTAAVVLGAPGMLDLQTLSLLAPGADDVVIDVLWSGVSSGTERLLYRGTMPPFPGLRYPLVPGYESVGRVRWCGERARRVRAPGQLVFVPGARCYREAEGLFGGAAATLVVPATRAVPVPDALGADATLLALAATAHHALALAGRGDSLIVGHGTLGRLLGRLSALPGPWAAGCPVVWETAAERRAGSWNHPVLDPRDDPRHDYPSIIDVSGDPDVLDSLVSRLAPGGQIVLAGFYQRPLQFEFAPAFMREACIRIAAQWAPDDLAAVASLAAAGTLALDGLITHRVAAAEAARAYRQAFDDPECLKLILEWRQP